MLKTYTITPVNNKILSSSSAIQARNSQEAARIYIKKIFNRYEDLINNWFFRVKIKVQENHKKHFSSYELEIIEETNGFTFIQFI